MASPTSAAFDDSGELGVKSALGLPPPRSIAEKRGGGVCADSVAGLSLRGVFSEHHGFPSRWVLGSEGTVLILCQYRTYAVRSSYQMNTMHGKKTGRLREASYLETHEPARRNQGRTRRFAGSNTLHQMMV
jgi:hypothetical protein